MRRSRGPTLKDEKETQLPSIWSRGDGRCVSPFAVVIYIGPSLKPYKNCHQLILNR